MYSFEHIYDARVFFFTDKPKIEKLKAKNIEVGNLVILEVLVNRYNGEQYLS